MSNLNAYKNMAFEEQIRLPLNVQMKLSSAGLLKSPSGPAIQTRTYGIPRYENGRARGMNTFNRNLNASLAAIRGTAVPAFKITEVKNRKNLTRRPAAVPVRISNGNNFGFANPMMARKQVMGGAKRKMKRKTMRKRK